jgi:hypothetical protein
MSPDAEEAPMKSPAEVEVTLPRRVLGRLRREADATGLPLAWLVAALVAALADEPAPADGAARAA